MTPTCASIDALKACVLMGGFNVNKLHLILQKTINVDAKMNIFTVYLVIAIIMHDYRMNKHCRICS
jgi:hypothetical protein